MKKTTTFIFVAVLCLCLFSDAQRAAFAYVAPGDFFIDKESNAMFAVISAYVRL